MKILIDAFGGDNAPHEIIMGSISAVNLNPDLFLTLVGKQNVIEKELNDFGYVGNQIDIINANDIVSNNESPTMAIKSKTDSSLVVALEKLKESDEFDGFVSAGSTGAVLTGALLKVGRIRGVSRPALAPILPNKKGGQTLLVDCGANMDSKPQFLVDFAIMGTAYMQSVYGIEKPRVALVNVGTEDKKGNELTHEVFDMLKENENINFVGNMEARDALSGEFDVLVSDGFAGNVLLKSVEGTAGFIMGLMKEEVAKANIFGKLGALLMKKTIKKMAHKLDYKNVGGSPFLGVQKVVIKAHGSSDAKCFYSAIMQAKKLIDCKLVDNIKSYIGE